MGATRKNRRGYENAGQTNAQKSIKLDDLARFRQATYRFLSTMLLYPDEERLRNVAAVAEVIKEQGDFLATFPFFIQWRELLESLRVLADLKPERVEEEYVDVFMVNPDFSPCLPYESAYLESGAAATGWTAVQLDQEYRDAGLEISPNLNESPDHAAVELEFMAFLCDQESKAWKERCFTVGVEALKRQVAFLGRHLIQWFPMFAREVAGKNRSDIYAGVARTVQAFISHDRDLLEALLKRFDSRSDTQPTDSVSKTPAHGMD